MVTVLHNWLLSMARLACTTGGQNITMPKYIKTDSGFSREYSEDGQM